MPDKNFFQPPKFNLTQSEEVNSGSDIGFFNDDKACFSELSSSLMMNEVSQSMTSLVVMKLSSKYPVTFRSPKGGKQEIERDL